MKKVNCLGVMVLDALSGPLKEYPVPKTKPQVLTDSIRFHPGGGAVNTSSALAQIGINVSVFSKLGNDVNGQFLIKPLLDLGVNTDNICISENDSTI